MPPFLTDEEMKLAEQARTHGFGDDDDEPIDDGKPAADAPPADEPAAASDGTPPADPPADPPGDTPPADAAPSSSEPAAADDDRPDVPSTFAPTLRGEDPAAYDERLKGVAQARMDATKAWRNGEMDDDAYDAKIAELESQKDALIEARVEAKVANKFNAETAQQVFSRDMDSFLGIMSKYEGVPYKSNAMLMNAFRTELAAAGKKALEAKEDPGAQELFERAHKAVLEQAAALGMALGKKTPAPAPAPAPAPSAAAAAAAQGAKAGTKPAVPPTLGKMPAAAAAPTGSSMDEALASISGLEGEELEIAVAKLPADAKRRLLMQD